MLELGARGRNSTNSKHCQRAPADISGVKDVSVGAFKEKAAAPEEVPEASQRWSIGEVKAKPMSRDRHSFHVWVCVQPSARFLVQTGDLFLLPFSHQRQLSARHNLVVHERHKRTHQLACDISAPAVVWRVGCSPMGLADRMASRSQVVFLWHCEREQDGSHPFPRHCG